MQVEKDPTLGFRLAEGAYRSDRSNPHAYSALLNAFYSHSPFYRAVFRHKDNVNSAGFSPDGKYIVTASKDKTTKLWDLNGNEIRVFKHEDVVRSACFPRDGKYIITTTADAQGKTLYHYWDFKRESLKPGTAVNMNEIFTSPEIAPDGATLAIPEDPTVVILCDSRGNSVEEFKGHTEEVEKAVFSPDGKYVVTAGYDDTARLWNITPVSSSLVQKNRPPGLPFDFKKAVSPDKRFTVSVEWSNSPQLRDNKTNRVLRMTGHEKTVNSAAFSPSGEYIVTASMDGTARLWDLEGNEKQVFKGHKESVNSACFSPDGKYIITTGSDKTARLWLPDGTPVFEFNGFSESIKAAVFSIDGKYIIVTPASGAEEYRLVDPGEIISTADRAGLWKLDEEIKKKYNL